MTGPKILLYLHHVELGQRYPISEDVIIGRLTGHILFPKDERMSDQHCRIFLGPDNNLMIKDLESDHGTVVDGRLISPTKTYPIREGTTIAVGGQVFKCVEPKRRPKPPRKRTRKKVEEDASISPIFLLVVVALLVGVAVHMSPPLKAQMLQALRQVKTFIIAKSGVALPDNAPIQSPFDMVYQEIQGAYGQYKSIGKEVETGLMNSKAMAQEFRNSLIPKFQAAQAKLSVLKPANEIERRRIEANTRLVNSILKQISAMASFAETKNPKYAKLIETATPEVEAAGEEARKVNNLRVPAGNQFGSKKPID